MVENGLQKLMSFPDIGNRRYKCVGRYMGSLSGRYGTRSRSFRGCHFSGDECFILYITHDVIKPFLPALDVATVVVVASNYQFERKDPWAFAPEIQASLFKFG